MAGKKHKNQPPRPGRNARKKPAARKPRSYTPLSDALSQPNTFADTELSEGIRRHGLLSLLGQALGRQRRSNAQPLAHLLCALLVWPLLKVTSLHCFCAELGQILVGKVSVLYDFLGREDINWRGLSSALARRVNQANEIGPSPLRAWVVDDSNKARSGKKVQGTSCHYDHTNAKTLKGHQLLQLGLAGEKGFLPVESQIVMGEKAAVDKPADKPFKDQRSSSARDLKRAREMTKQQLFREMLQRALRAGFRAAYVLGDAWFGCKENILVCLENQLTGIFQMKRGKLHYKYQGKHCTAKELYLKVQRRMRPKNKQARYKTAALEVKINLQTSPDKPAHWAKVQLLFSAPVRNDNSESWVLFVCTDLKMKPDQILKVYALRWSIEVYFKEIKQSLGFLKEQSGRYEVAYASVHLAAIRYLLLFEAMLRNGALSYGEIRDRQTGQLQILTYAGLLWQLFRALIEGALESLVGELGRRVVAKVARAINQTVDTFLNDALQMNPKQVAAQLKAEELGYL